MPSHRVRSAVRSQYNLRARGFVRPETEGVGGVDEEDDDHSRSRTSGRFVKRWLAVVKLHRARLRASRTSSASTGGSVGQPDEGAPQEEEESEAGSTSSSSESEEEPVNSMGDCVVVEEPVVEEASAATTSTDDRDVVVVEEHERIISPELATLEDVDLNMLTSLLADNAPVDHIDDPSGFTSPSATCSSSAASTSSAVTAIPVLVTPGIDPRTAPAVEFHATPAPPDNCPCWCRRHQLQPAPQLVRCSCTFSRCRQQQAVPCPQQYFCSGTGTGGWYLPVPVPPSPVSHCGCRCSGVQCGAVSLSVSQSFCQSNPVLFSQPAESPYFSQQ